MSAIIINIQEYKVRRIFEAGKKYLRKRRRSEEEMIRRWILRISQSYIEKHEIAENENDNDRRYCRYVWGLYRYLHILPNEVVKRLKDGETVGFPPNFYSKSPILVKKFNTEKAS